MKKLKFKNYCLIERSLEELNTYDTNDIEDMLTLAHEIEYKIHKISTSPLKANLKLVKNILVRYSNVFDDLFKKIKYKFETCYQSWNNNHRTESPEEWSEMVLNSYYDTMGADMDALREEIVAGNFSIDWGEGSITASDIYPFIYDSMSDYDKKSVVRDYISEGEGWRHYLYKSDLRDAFLRQNSELTDDEIENMDSHDSEEWLNENDKLNDFEDHLISNLDAKELIEESPESFTYFISETTILLTIQNILYEDYMMRFGGIIDGIKRDIIGAIERMEASERNIDDKLFDATQDLEFFDPDIDDYQVLYKAIQSMSKIISEAMASLSLALSVNHYSGNIIGDETGITEDFMDDLHQKSVDEWDEEIGFIVKSSP